MSFPENDEQWEEYAVDRVGDGFFHMVDGASFGIREEWPIKPKVGDTVRLYGKGFGYTVRGLYVNGECAFYHTEADWDALQQKRIEEEAQKRITEWETTGKAIYEAKKAALPEVFQKRLNRFESNQPKFGPEFGGYEMICCEEAVRIAEALKTADAVEEFAGKPFEEQRKAVPNMAHGHSGNTFAMSVRLAHHYVSTPELVWRDHAAISALVGCEEAGCPPIPPDGN